MTYLPFKELEIGTIFYSIDKKDIPFLKSSKSHAVLLASIWQNGLVPRGTQVPFSEDTCILQAEEAEEITLPICRVDPIDPSRKFWNENTVAKVGKRNPVEIKVFAGLFLYSGFGSGTYYAATKNEIFFKDAGTAQKMAEKEGVRFINHDSQDLATNEYFEQLLERPAC